MHHIASTGAQTTNNQHNNNNNNNNNNNKRYSWLEEYTAREKWVGWNYTKNEDDGDDAAGQPAEAFDSFREVQDVMQSLGFTLHKKTNLPFVMREHRRKYQLGVSECTAWRKDA